MSAVHLSGALLGPLAVHPCGAVRCSTANPLQSAVVHLLGAVRCTPSSHSGAPALPLGRCTRDQRPEVLGPRRVLAAWRDRLGPGDLRTIGAKT
jgi:hypothetical protein